MSMQRVTRSMSASIAGWSASTVSMSDASACGGMTTSTSWPASIVLGQISAPFPPAVAYRLLLSSFTAAIEGPGLDLWL